MEEAKIRGISIHTTGDGLAYYVHYDELGTVRVDKEMYERAMAMLEKWDLLIHRKKKESLKL